MSDPHKKALFDELAERLSEKTGTEFKVIREHYGHEVSGRKMVKYRIAVSMYGKTLAFGEEKDSNRVAASIAMLLDLVNVGVLSTSTKFNQDAVLVSPTLQQSVKALGFTG